MNWEGWCGPNSLSCFTDEEIEAKAVKWQVQAHTVRRREWQTSDYHSRPPMVCNLWLSAQQEKGLLNNMWVVYVPFIWKQTISRLFQFSEDSITVVAPGPIGSGLDLSPSYLFVELSSFSFIHIWKMDQIIDVFQQLVKLHKAIREMDLSVKTQSKAQEISCIIIESVFPFSSLPLDLTFFCGALSLWVKWSLPLPLFLPEKIEK